MNATLECPRCGNPVPDGETVCPTCQEDLSALLRLQAEHLRLYNEALVAAREGNLEEAQARLLAALSLNDAFAPAHALLAKVRARLGRWQEAKASAQRAADLAPNDAAMVNLPALIEEAEREAMAAQALRERESHQTLLSALSRGATRHRAELAVAFGAGLGLAALVSLGLRIFFGKTREGG